MKRMALAIGVVLTIFFLVVSSASATTWYTYREDVAIGSGYADINLVYSTAYGPVTPGLNVSGNITLPCNIGNLTTMNFSVYNGNIGAGYYNLSVNGIGLNSSSTIAAGATNWTTFAQYTTAGGSSTLTYIAWSINCSVDTTFNVTIIGTDVTLDTTWLDTVITVQEKDLTTPTVGMSQPASFWTVNDSCNVTSNLAVVNLSNVVFNVTYPGHTVGTPSTTTFTIAELAVVGTNEQYTQYQKRGPYVYDVDGEISGRTHEVTIKLNCEELLTNIVDWSVYPADDKYDGAFETLDYNTLDVEQNGVGRDWEQGSIELEEFTVFSSIFNNRWVFTWTEPSVVPPVTPDLWDGFVDWMNDDSIGIPNWLGILVVIALIAMIGIVYSYRKK